MIARPFPSAGRLAAAALIALASLAAAGGSTSDSGREPGAAGIPVTREVATLMEQAREALEAREFLRAADLFDAALRAGPDGLQPARVGYAIAQLALEEHALALGAVLDGLAREPRHPELLELLGDLRDREERVQDALGAWLEAQAARGDAPLERLEHKIERARRELAAGRDFSMSASSHFTLRHDGEVDRALTRAILDHLEQEFWRVGRELDHTPRQPITVLLYPSRAFHAATGAEAWVGGLFDGKIRVPLGGLDRLADPARRVLTHELTHAVLHAKTRGNCPRWLHEGLAQRAEPRRLGAADREQVARFLAGGSAAAMIAGGGDVSYPAALSLTEFVAGYWGETALLRLLTRLGEGLAIETALAEVYGETPASLARRWAAAAAREAGR